jgi:hypothetical protein
MSQGREGVRWGRIILVLFVLVVINVPYGLHEYQLHRAATSGVRVSATVVDVTPAGDDANVSFRLPKSIDAKQTVRTAKVDGQVGQRASQTKQLSVRVLEGHPGAFRADGQVRTYGGLIFTVVADLLVAGMLILSWRLGGRLRRPTLVGIAVEDVESGSEGSVLDKQEDGTYVINGEVAEAGPSTLLLTLHDRDVEINLRDHENSVAVGEWARVRAQLVG